MSTSIEVNKQSTKELLESACTNHFVIPQYQRPYSWNSDQVQTLFDDLVEYTKSHPNALSESNPSAYFLGCIVSFNNDQNEQEIIDGQQRVTTLLLLLRAIYTKLKMPSSSQSKESINFQQQIEPMIWEKDKLTGEVNFSCPLMSSRAIDDYGNDIFKNILKTGESIDSSKDNYSLNYRLLQNLFDNYSKQDPLSIFDFIFNVLNNTIMLPIKADSQDTALTIFSTLNDRGLPLSDADIFKSQLYNKVSDKEDFIEKWQSLEERALNTEESMQSLFYYYMFYLKALENDRNTTVPGVRKYYSKDNFRRLYSPVLLKDLNTILNIWSVVNNHQSIEEEAWSKNLKILQTLDILSSYPNEFWKYPVIVYYLRKRKEPNFESSFESFLKRFLANILARYIVVPTLNAVKSNIINLNASIIEDDEPQFNFRTIDKKQLYEQIGTPHRNAVRMILKVIAYQDNNQKRLLPEKWEIEHILPQQWKTMYFGDQSEEKVKEFVEHIGNKIPFEKRLNIKASNGFFERKRKLYRSSNIAVTRALSESDKNDWKLDDINNRDEQIRETLISLLESWSQRFLIE